MHVQQLAGKFNLRDWSGIGPWFQSTFRTHLFDKEEVFTLKTWIT